MTSRASSTATAAAILLVLAVNGSVSAGQIEWPVGHTGTIEDPRGAAMRHFHESLTHAFQCEGVTRIIHYGDSHIAADILTGAVRTEFRSWFGDAGAGFVLPGRPWPGYSRAGVTSQTSAGWNIDGLKQTSLATDGRLGLAGVSLSTTEQGQWISVTAPGTYFDVYAMRQPGGGSICLSLDGVEQKTNISLAGRNNESEVIEVVARLDTIHTLEIRTTTPGWTRIFGIAIERNCSGVTYDALGINGARASRPLQWDWGVLAGSLANRDPDLIVVSYGSNEVSDVDLDLDDYGAHLTRLLNQFHEAAPRASILVISPPDRAVKTRQGWKTVARMRALVEAQRQAAFAANAAFYDLFKAMGGAGSIERWAVRLQPLAQPDRVHLTSNGYKLVADWLYSALMNGYLEAISKNRAANSTQRPY